MCARPSPVRCLSYLYCDQHHLLSLHATLFSVLDLTLTRRSQNVPCDTTAQHDQIMACEGVGRAELVLNDAGVTIEHYFPR